MSEQILVIGDPHTEAGQDLSRFNALGNYILEEQPTHIVSMGDFLSIDALSHWDLNKRALIENKRFKKELDAGKEAMNKMMAPIKEYNKTRASAKKKQYNPEKIFIEGNHEDRWFRYTDTRAELIGLIDMYKEIGVYDYGWELIKYKSYKFISGIGFTHIPMDGSNSPLRGMRYMQTAARDHVCGLVFGHTHRLAFETYAKHGEHDHQTYALNAGWFGSDIPKYAQGSKGSKDWWSGIIMVEPKGGGRFDYSICNIATLYSQYL